MYTLLFILKIFIDIYIISLLIYFWIKKTNSFNLNNSILNIIKQVNKPILYLQNIIPYFESLNFFIISSIIILTIIKIKLLTLIKIKIPYSSYFLLILILSLIKINIELTYIIILIKFLITISDINNNNTKLVLEKIIQPIDNFINYIFPITKNNIINLSTIVIITTYYVINYIGKILLPKIWNYL